MLSFIQKPQSLTLSGAIEPIIISSDIDIIFSVSKLTEVIFSRTYSPDTDDLITIYDISEILEAYLINQIIPTNIQHINELSGSFSIKATNGVDADITESFTAVFGKIGLQGDHSLFFEQHFLTMLQGKKTTKPSQTEYLSFLSSIGAHTITVNYTTLGGDLYSELLYSVTTTARGVYSFPINFSLINVDPYGIAAFSIVINCAGNYSLQFDYAMDPNYYDRQMQFLFINRFGVCESFSSVGKRTRDINSDKMSIVNTVTGKKRVGYVEQALTTNTGLQPSNQQAHWMMDFFESEKCWYIDGSSTPKEIIIDSPSTEYDPDDAITRNFSFSFFFANSKKIAFTSL